MKGARILVTGATGQLAFPVVEHMATRNEVWGAARLRDPSARERLVAVGARPAALDLADPDWTELPDQVDVVLHFAADITGDDDDRAIATNAEGTALLLARYHAARAALVVSTSAVYDLHDDPTHRFVETDRLGDSKPLFGPTYPVSKIAQEAVARSMSRVLDLPVTIARMNLSYGPNGGLPAYQLDAIRRGDPVTVAPGPTFHNPIHQDDVVASVPRLLEVASIGATITNWAGPETVSMRDYCHWLGELVGRPVTFDEVSGFMRSRAIDVTRQHQLVGPARLDWRAGMEALVAARS
ncbi:MAG: NAD(P)-dependent oxidoreductase [Acidimicrobiia bacterium]|nr:NAD(P)-dependent oxidoreductase [Acidimicrobiia bacterium]